jgi:muramoyltetrapeptide carboxypeptidase
VIVPPGLKPGSEVRVIAPSGPFDRALFGAAVGWLSSRHRVTYDRDIFAQEGFLAGHDSRRREELQSAIDDPNVSAIVTARGGWGAGRIVSSVDFSGLVRTPKWIVGFSDATTLHASAWHVGVASLHAANLATLGKVDTKARSQWLHALEEPHHERMIRGIPLVGGRCEGILVGGNLSIIVSCLSKGKLTLPSRCILALEDVAESSYRIDRMLDALLSCNLAGRIAGVVLGQFVDCDSGKYAVSTSQILQEQFCRFGVPTLSELEFGHGNVNQPLLLGQPALLDALRGELNLGAFQTRPSAA